ncbi:MAG: hypothetical protein HKN14_01040 [Marinicaulis sp.]|nr:hypothetical protein [Marinicaulis sp.]
MSWFDAVLAGAAAALIFSTQASAAPVMVRDNPDNGESVFASGLGRSVSIEHDGVARRRF